jgi:Domain of unknown function (DUF5916)/Carbohydrate family 9 binding domain-like
MKLATAAGLAAALALALPRSALARQTAPGPELRAGAVAGRVKLDGILDESGWTAAPSIETLTMSEPTAGAPPSAKTTVRVMADAHALFVGVVCSDPQPSRIVSFTKQRDAPLDAEDNVTIVLDTFFDGRSGYVFQVNPSGARYDALITPDNSDANSNWDGIWDAATHRDDHGWSVEIWIPVQTIGFKAGLRQWHFNVQRRIQRLQETDRWASARPDWSITQMSRAGILTGLPDFSVGLGLTVRPAVVGGAGIPAPDAPVDGMRHASLDAWKRLGPDVSASLSLNTDFAETEVDTRRTNLTRFPLFFPEKRTFFLEGSDIFQFGLDLGSDLVPLFSRRIGLLAERQVPIDVAGKINGRLGNTNFGGLIVRSGDVPGLVPSTVTAAARVKQNILSESSIGFIGTAGDPAGGDGSWLVGSDFTYATSHFRGGERNFRVGVSGQVMNRPGVTGDRTASAVKIDYPNDLWSLSWSTLRIGDAFQPALGFVPRAGIYKHDLGIVYQPRPHNGWLRQIFGEFETTMVTDLSGNWESYEVFTAPINWRLESGDRVEFNVVPEGERLTASFDLEGVRLPAGAYQWVRYRAEAGSAAKRKVSAQATWRFGGFYSGTLDQLLLVGSWHPSGLLSIDFSGERDLGRLKEGTFRATLLGVNSHVNVSPHLQVSSFVQYDTSSASVGTNARMRWTFTPAADLFVVYNHNVRDIGNIGWQLDSNQFLVKLQYAFRR